jgi:hypothetical protein
MLTSNSRGTQDLTQDKQILHHHAAMVKKDLDAYYADARSNDNWNGIFINHLVHFCIAINFYELISDSCRIIPYSFIELPIRKTQTFPSNFIYYY